MKPSTGTAVVAVAAGGFAAGRLLSRRRARSAGSRRPGWHAVTVNRPASEVAPRGRLPLPLARLGSGVEVRLQPASGDRGTELAARPRARQSAGVAGWLDRARSGPRHRAVRAALREAKQLVEAGDVLRPDAPDPTSVRSMR